MPLRLLRFCTQSASWHYLSKYSIAFFAHICGRNMRRREHCVLTHGTDNRTRQRVARILIAQRVWLLERAKCVCRMSETGSRKSACYWTVINFDGQPAVRRQDSLIFTDVHIVRGCVDVRRRETACTWHRPGSASRFVGELLLSCCCTRSRRSGWAAPRSTRCPLSCPGSDRRWSRQTLRAACAVTKRPPRMSGTASAWSHEHVVLVAPECIRSRP